MSHSTNSNVNFCDVFDLSFEKKKDLYRHQSCDSKHKLLLEKMFGSDDETPIQVKPEAQKVIPPSSQPIPENMERVYDSEEEYYFLKPKPKGALPLLPQTQSKSKTESKPKNNTKILLKLNPSINLKLKLKIVSTAELSMNARNVMQNFF